MSPFILEFFVKRSFSLYRLDTSFDLPAQLCGRSVWISARIRPLFRNPDFSVFILSGLYYSQYSFDHSFYARYYARNEQRFFWALPDFRQCVKKNREISLPAFHSSVFIYFCFSFPRADPIRYLYGTSDHRNGYPRGIPVLFRLLLQANRQDG